MRPMLAGALAPTLAAALSPLGAGEIDRHSVGIFSGGHCRWLLPSRTYLAGNVLSAWRPYGVSSTLKWQAVKWLSALPGVPAPGLSRLPGLPIIDPAALGLAVSGPLRIVAYIGRPGPRQKLVCTLIDKRGHAVAVLKVPMSPEARSALENEQSILRQLAQSHPDLCVPRPLRLGWSLFGQTALMGRPTGQRFRAEHADFLIALRDGDKWHDLATVAAALIDADQPMPPAIRSWLRTLSGIVPAVRQHGDFAPWNLRIQPNAALSALDWEYARIGGLPVWDIAHFHAQQAYLFRSRTRPLTAMEANPAYGHYLDRLGLTQAQGRDLFGLYCLATARRLSHAGQEAQARYLMGQLLMGLDAR
jgi:hypothetical protein